MLKACYVLLHAAAQSLIGQNVDRFEICLHHGK